MESPGEIETSRQEVNFSAEDIIVIVTFADKNPAIKLKDNKNNKRQLKSLFKELAEKLDKRHSVEDLQKKIEELEDKKRKELLLLEEAIITFYQENKCLYDYRLEMYKNQEKKNGLVKSLAADLIWNGEPPLEESWTAEDKDEVEKKGKEIQSTWKNLKLKYTREKKREGSTITTGKGRGEIYVVTWVHFTGLSFLDDVGEIPTSAEIADNETEAPSESKRGRYERGNKSDTNEQQKNVRWDKLLEAIKDSSPAQSAEAAGGPEDKWCSSIGTTLAKLTPLNQELAKTEIQKVISTFLKYEALCLPAPEFQVQTPMIASHAPHVAPHAPPVGSQPRHAGLQAPHVYSSPVGYGYGGDLYQGNSGRWSYSDNPQLYGDGTAESPRASYNGTTPLVPRRELASSFGAQIVDANNVLHD